eukprot:CAMPEP_0119338460 /NCGR_PEP_ID=MMETSP1333-20130426/96109_1 /TAXON_ID=418940 /ORGANISM="Scyphosphaera apsteinii, Strain RCC1455" /LENGTH=104 /DNA_ID=CAMNT_0007349747 /DNA_START=95 /DNA_END=410 /DNA_ORIENTATION=+
MILAQQPDGIADHKVFGHAELAAAARATWQVVGGCHRYNPFALAHDLDEMCSDRSVCEGEQAHGVKKREPSAVAASTASPSANSSRRAVLPSSLCMVALEGRHV